MKNPLIIIKKRWNNYLERLAKVNQDLYGRKRLDCCDMNHNQTQKMNLTDYKNYITK